MTDADVVSVMTAIELRELLIRKCSDFGRPCFAEAFIDGREFNLSLLAGEGGVQVLPPAEIDFVDFPAGKPRIVGSAAKWDEESFEYRATVRRFDTISRTDPVHGTLSSAALACWQTLGLSGYGRVDFRVDDSGRPWILEANANPCLSPDAGFAAAMEQAGLNYTEVIDRILRATLLPADAH
jgi:D-alanine-D-alanine ligase